MTALFLGLEQQQYKLIPIGRRKDWINEPQLLQMLVVVCVLLQLPLPTSPLSCVVVDSDVWSRNGNSL
jgi:hypothetical protein